MAEQNKKKVAVVTGASRGIGRAIALELASRGAAVVINYNGSEERAKEVQKEIEEKGFEVVDLTCLDVKKVQQKAIELAKEGFLVLILGKPEHPEVIAIKANAELYTDKVFVISDENDLKAIEQEITKHKRVGIVIQTTQKIELLKDITSKVIPLSSEIKIFNTICKSTSLRQQEARELAKTSDLMVVVGSKKSANTTHLAEILQDITNTVHIENASDLNEYKDLLNKATNIGVTAGASTPDDVIKEVIKYLENT